MNRTIQIHVKERILIVPDSSRRISYSIAHEPDPVVTGIGLNLGYRGASIRPSLDGRLHSHRVTGLIEYEIGRPAANRKLLIGEIVKHVALVRMGLAPGVLMRGDVGGFSIITGAWVLSWDQIRHVSQDSMRHTVVAMANVVVGSGFAVFIGSARKIPGKRIDPRARTDAVLIAIQA